MIIGVINSAISWYYYLRVVVAMFFAEPAVGFKPPALSKSLVAGLILAVLGTHYLGLMPDRVLNKLEEARDRITAIKINK